MSPGGKPESYRSHPEGRKADRLPVQQVTKVELCINQVTARSLA